MSASSLSTSDLNSRRVSLLSLYFRFEFAPPAFFSLHTGRDIGKGAAELRIAFGVVVEFLTMGMKDLLPCRLAVRKADIYPFTLDPAITQCGGNAPRDAKHLRAFFLVQLRKITGMPVGNYKRMPGIDGLMVQKS